MWQGKYIKTIEYWVNIDKQQVAGGWGPIQRQLLGTAISEHTTQQNAEVESIVNNFYTLGSFFAVNVWISCIPVQYIDGFLKTTGWIQRVY